MMNESEEHIIKEKKKKKKKTHIIKPILKLTYENNRSIYLSIFK